MHGEVDVVITDSPLLLSIVYNDNPILGDDFNKTIFNVFNSYNNLNYFINRVKPYNPKGRWQSEYEAKKIDLKVKETLKSFGVECTKVNGDVLGYEDIVNQVVDYLEFKEQN